MIKRLTKMDTAIVLLLVGGGRFTRVERADGQTIVEYALILALIAVAAFGAIFFLRNSISNLFSDIGSHL